MQRRNFEGCHGEKLLTNKDRVNVCELAEDVVDDVGKAAAACMWP